MCIRDSAEIVERFAVLRAAYGYKDVALLDTQGQPVINLGDHVELYTRLKPLITQALVSGRTQRSDLYQDETGQIHLDWVVPITQAEPEGRRLVATVGLHIEPEHLLVLSLIHI